MPIEPPIQGDDLVRREHELRDFVENAAVALSSVAEDGTILWANRAELELFGYSAAEYIGHNIVEFHLDAPAIHKILEQLSIADRFECEARILCRDGSIRYVSMNSSVYRSAGKFIHTRCVTVDITERQKTAEVRHLLAAIVESSDDAVVSKDMHGTIRSWNRGAERIFGYSAKEMIGRHISTLATPDNADEIPLVLARIARGERVEHYKTRRKTKDGKILAVSLTVSPIRDENGIIIGASKVARDITEESGLGTVREQLAAIVESSDDAILSKDLQGIIRSWNRGAERIFGYKPDEIVGKHISTLAAPERADEIPNILERIARGERVDHYETKRKTKSGEILTVSLTVSPIHDATGRIIGASKVARDISERHRHEAALREANAALKRSNADLQQFADSASHDLREPLRMVSIYSELLKAKFGGTLGPTGDEYIGYTVAGALQMERLLKDLRAFTELSRRELEPQEDVDADEVLKKALAKLEDQIAATGAVIVSSPLPRVRVYEFQLEQLFQNLIANALRYRSSAAPSIDISARQQDKEWLFSVRDNGIGIDPQFKEQIFGMFKRLHTSAEYPGTGMGLAICRRIVERSGGRIWVDSHRARFNVFLYAPAEESSGHSPEGRKPASILLVEDNHGDAGLVREALNEHHVHGELVHISDGQEAINYIRAFDAQPPAHSETFPDLIILDLNLPKRSGREVLEVVRLSARCGQLPVVILSSSDARQDREDTLRLGAGMYLTKPSRLAEFLMLGATFKALLGQWEAS